MQTLQQLQNGELTGATSLTFSEGLTEFPRKIFDLADTLEYLDLSNNKLTSLPADFGRLQKLKIFFGSRNLFTVLPEVLGDCPLLDIAGFKANLIATISVKALNPNLRWLILTDNQITQIPPAIGNCPRLQKLMLAGNRLKTLPLELSRCQNLGLLRISANQLTALPQWLLTMPKLSWLAFSGNPFCAKPAVQAMATVHWNDLQIAELLGEGASGLIYKAAHGSPNGREVAVKVFKGAVTSDGFPEDEMAICITAGAHTGLVQVIGQIGGHPEGKTGLVMELIPSHYYNLGLPPSLASCTRDVFKEGLSLTAKQVLDIARTIASVAMQLHSKGIMHSDMYAHNILIDDEGHTLFSDFGAACFYDTADTELAPLLERIEVSAYGYLLDDLIGLCEDAGNDNLLLNLSQIRNLCHLPIVALRPGFSQIHAELRAMITGGLTR